MVATEKILEAVDHVLNVLSRKEELWKKLNHWKNTSKGEDCSSDYVYQKGSISFDLLTEVHQQLQQTPMGMN